MRPCPYCGAMLPKPDSGDYGASHRCTRCEGEIVLRWKTYPTKDWAWVVPSGSDRDDRERRNRNE